MGCGVVYDGAGFPLLSLPVGVSVISSSSEGITSTSDSLLAFWVELFDTTPATWLERSIFFCYVCTVSIFIHWKL